MDHLDVVSSTLVTNPLAAGLAVRLGRDALEDVLDERPGLLVTTGHDGGTVAGTLLTTRDTGTDETDVLGCQVLGAAVGVGEVRVATVNDDITLLKATLGEEELNEVVDGLAGHDEHHADSGLAELGDKLLDGVSTDNGLALGLVLKEAVNLGDGTVEGNAVEAVVGGVEDQVLTHDGQTDETEVTAIGGELLACRVCFGSQLNAAGGAAERWASWVSCFGGLLRKLAAWWGWANDLLCFRRHIVRSSIELLCKVVQSPMSGLSLRGRRVGQCEYYKGESCPAEVHRR